MKILKTATTPGGIEIRLEDWSEDFSFYHRASTIAAYPKKYLRRRGEADFQSYEEASCVFDALQSGDVRVIDVNFTMMEHGGRRIPLAPLLEERMNLYNQRRQMK